MNAFLETYSLVSSVLKLKPAGRQDFIDLTDEVTRRVAESGISNGHVIVFSRHTTAGIFVNENEPLLLDDYRRYLDRLASPDAFYSHDDLTIRTENLIENEPEPANGHSHHQHLIIGCSQHIPVMAGEVALGRWQRIFFVELDSARDREVIIQVCGC